MSLFTVKDYRSFIREKLHEHRAQRGYQTLLAKAAGVHTSYISRVMNSHVHLTVDQAANLAEFWQLDPEETDFFTDLVQVERSSSLALKRRIGQRLTAIRRSRENLAQRFSRAQSLEVEDQGVYYSTWYFSAVHMLLTIPGYDSVPAISQRLQLSEDIVRTALEILERKGLARQSQSRWQALQADLHIAEQKMWARIQHGHWRQKTALKIQEFDPEAVHYSGVHTMSVSDAIRLKHLLVQFLDKSRKIIAPSAEEDLFFLGCDFYRI